MGEERNKTSTLANHDNTCITYYKVKQEACKVVVGCRPLGGNVRYSALEPGTRSQSAIADALARRSSAYHSRVPAMSARFWTLRSSCKVKQEACKVHLRERCKEKGEKSGFVRPSGSLPHRIVVFRTSEVQRTKPCPMPIPQQFTGHRGLSPVHALSRALPAGLRPPLLRSRFQFQFSSGSVA